MRYIFLFQRLRREGRRLKERILNKVRTSYAHHTIADCQKGLDQLGKMRSGKEGGGKERKKKEIDLERKKR